MPKSIIKESEVTVGTSWRKERDNSHRPQSPVSMPFIISPNSFTIQLFYLNLFHRKKNVCIHRLVCPHSAFLTACIKAHTKEPGLKCAILSTSDATIAWQCYKQEGGD